MIDRNLARGAFLACLALAFGLAALRYPMGDFVRAGPGLFPVLVSSLLLGLALVSIAQSRLVEAVPLTFNVRNIALVMLALASFVVFSKLVNIALGIVAMVVLASLAGRSFSWKRCLQVSIGLILVALAFQKLLGLNLRLI